jgi:hypothetical protein
LQEYGLRCVDFTTEIAAWINLIFRLVDLLIVSCFFGVTIKKRRRCTLDLSVVVTTYFGQGFLQSTFFHNCPHPGTDRTFLLFFESLAPDARPGLTNEQMPKKIKNGGETRH